MSEAKPIDTPIIISCKLDSDEPSLKVNKIMYRGIIRSFLYLRASRHDVIFSVGMCARF